ncbi:MAG: response regulator [Oligoflexia bacterium]|nr:response regulator [Oligoflexia bacterium]
MAEKQKESSVLFIDDEEDILNVMKRLFKDEITHIHVANNANSALEILRENDIDVVVLDYKMPEKDGLTLLKEMKAIKERINFIMITAFGDKELVQNALREEIIDVIDKPFNINYVKKTVHNAIQKAHYQLLVKGIVDIFLANYAHLDFNDFSKLNFEEREKTIQTVIEIAKHRITNSNKDKE